MLKPTVLLVPLLLATLETSASQDETTAPATATVAAPTKPLTVERGAGRVPFVIPARERLVFDVVLDIGVLGETRVGTFTMSAGTESYRKGLPQPGVVEASEKLAGWLLSEGKGRYLGYTLDHSTESRFLPQEWPRLIHRDTQQGSENRRRELMYGTRDGAPMAWYRSDTHCDGCDRREHVVEGSLFSTEHHCTKCKRAEHRVWNKPKLEPSVDGAIDTQASFFLARALVASADEVLSFPLLEKDRHWLVTFHKGERKTLDVPAGTFHCREMKMTAEPPEGSQDRPKFKGLLGMHGSLSLWLEERTGVLVRITGLLPLGPIDLDVSIELSEFAGTPEGFAPVSPRK